MEQFKKDLLGKKTKEELYAMDRKDFTLSECQEIINETRLTKLDRDIANLRVIKCMNFDEIAKELYIDKRTAITHWKDTSARLKNTIVMLFYTGEDLY